MLFSVLVYRAACWMKRGDHDSSTGFFPGGSGVILPPTMGWAGWSRQSHGGRVWWVNSWICSADWIYLGLDRVRTVCWKEQYCWSLAGSFPSVPGPVAVGFLLLLWTGVGHFSTSLLQALAIRKAWPHCCLSGGLGCPLLSGWLFCCSALCTLYVGRKNTSTRL